VVTELLVDTELVEIAELLLVAGELVVTELLLLTSTEELALVVVTFAGILIVGIFTTNHVPCTFCPLVWPAALSPE
jgi:hypothetical protein